MAEEQEIKQPIDDERGVILQQWVFPEFQKYERSPLWYSIALIGGGGLFIWAALDGNFLFAVIIVLTALISFLHHRNEPNEILLTIFERGIQMGDRYWPYNQVESFSIVYEPPAVKTLYLVTTGALRREYSIPLLNTDPLTIRETLLQYVSEDLSRNDENGNDKWRRALKL